MANLIVDPEFWEIFPAGQINVLVVKGIKNQAKAEEEPYFKELLAKAVHEAKNFLIEETFSQNDVIVQWRKAFTQFKTKKGARSSIEALLKRVSQERIFQPINPLVDLYNSVSLTHGVPCGGEDLASLEGDLHLGKAQGGEAFLPLGTEKSAPALPEEIIYYDQAGAVCRCLNWREAQRTMLTEKTNSAVLVIEAVYPQQIARSEQAIEALKTLVEQYFHVESSLWKLTKAEPIAEWD